MLPTLKGASPYLITVVLIGIIGTLYVKIRRVQGENETIRSKNKVIEGESSQQIKDRELARAEKLMDEITKKMQELHDQEKQFLQNQLKEQDRRIEQLGKEIDEVRVELKESEKARIALSEILADYKQDNKEKGKLIEDLKKRLSTLEKQYGS